MIELHGDDSARLRGLGLDPAPVARAALALAASLASGGKLLTFGNGGSAADAQHMAAELVGRFELERPAWPALALTTDSSVLTAISNDFGFGRVFARQVEGLGRHGDVALGISTSGSSENVLEGIRAARAKGLVTIGLCGAPGCALCDAVDIPIAVGPGPAAAVQEAHIVIEHAICRTVEANLVASPLRPRGPVADLAELLVLREAWRAGHRRVVWTNGCFDLLHFGHLTSLRAARQFGDVLLVGLNSDAAVRRLKGAGRPLIPVQERAELIAALEPVDHVVVFDDDTPEAILAQLQPDVHCKGVEYAPPNGRAIPERALVESYGGVVEFLPLVAGRSTTALAEAMRASAHPA